MPPPLLLCVGSSQMPFLVIAPILACRFEIAPFFLLRGLSIKANKTFNSPRWSRGEECASSRAYTWSCSIDLRGRSVNKAACRMEAHGEAGAEKQGWPWTDGRMDGKVCRQVASPPAHRSPNSPFLVPVLLPVT